MQMQNAQAQMQTVVESKQDAKELALPDPVKACRCNECLIWQLWSLSMLNAIAPSKELTEAIGRLAKLVT